MRRSEKPLALTGIRAGHPDAAGTARTGGGRIIVRRGASALSIASVAVLLAGCTASDDGVVLTGADGQSYVVPDGGERPLYTSKEDCIADVTEQIQTLQNQGESIGDNPEDLCESSSLYPNAHYGAGWLGPIIFAGSRWNSSRVSSWSSLSNGGFGARGSAVQPDVVQPAPAGAKSGDRATLKGGFGASGKSGFGESAGGRTSGS